VAFLMWWVLAKLGTGQGIDRGRQPVRIALFILALPVLFSVVALFLRPRIADEVTGAERGLLLMAALSGVALLAADGISSLERAHTLMRRVVHGSAFVAATGIYQFVTGYNPGRRVSIPGLVSNIVVVDQDRSSFTRVQGTALHPIELGTLMGIVLPIAVHYALLARGRRARQIAWIEVGAMGTALAMAISRTGVVTVVITMLVFAAEWSWKRRAQALGIVAVFLVGLRLAIPGLVGTMLSLFTKIDEDTSTQVRSQRYGIAGHYFRQHPWFGRGFSTLFAATHQVFDNGWLYIATELGIAGIIGLALFFIILTFTARGARLRSTDLATHGLGQALAGVFLAMIVAFGTADMMSFTMLMGILFLMAGVTGALWRLTGGATGVTPPPRRAYRSWSPPPSGTDPLEPPVIEPGAMPVP
jgi:O-antigen ligase